MFVFRIKNCPNKKAQDEANIQLEKSASDKTKVYIFFLVINSQICSHRPEKEK